MNILLNFSEVLKDSACVRLRHSLHLYYIVATTYGNVSFYMKQNPILATYIHCIATLIAPQYITDISIQIDSYFGDVSGL